MALAGCRIRLGACMALLGLGSLLAMAQGLPVQETARLEAEELLAVELRGVITSWASAWQSQLDDVYLLHYHPDFKPEGFSTRQAWIENRRARIQNPADITITLSEFALITHDDTTALVRFWQHYRRPGYADDTNKEMLLQKSGQIWQIKQEHNIEVVRRSPP